MNRKERRARAKEKPVRVLMPSGHLYDYTSAGNYVLKMKGITKRWSPEVISDTSIA